MYYIYESCTGEIFINKHSMENLQCDICGDWNEFLGNFPVRSNFQRIKENYKEIRDYESYSAGIAFLKEVLKLKDIKSDVIEKTKLFLEQLEKLEEF